MMVCRLLSLMSSTNKPPHIRSVFHPLIDLPMDKKKSPKAPKLWGYSEVLWDNLLKLKYITGYVLIIMTGVHRGSFGGRKLEAKGYNFK